ncbi:hypothetical protein AGMMS50268_22700 [Spirochaetia bacterium]|nr:hypothetical protein AGMMS50268_22700 [Spirochaetia bacterium]
MVICVKCVREQGRRSSSKCEYDGDKSALPDHAWIDREEFFAELREKLTPFIRDRIAGWQKNYAEKQALFNERIKSYNKRLDEIQAAHDVYLKEGLPRDVEKEKQRAIRSRLPEVIGGIIGAIIGDSILVLVIFKLAFPLFNIEFTPFVIVLSMIAMIVLLAISLGKPVKVLLQAKRYSESQEFADELAGKWLVNNGIYELKSAIEAEKDKWNSSRWKFEHYMHSAERALVGSDKDLLDYYKLDKKVKHEYVEHLYARDSDDREW